MANVARVDMILLQVLMSFLVGNDFIPHLPNLHIANGALPILYKIYIEILPSFDGSYIVICLHLNKITLINLITISR